MSIQTLPPFDPCEFGWESLTKLNQPAHRLTFTFRCTMGDKSTTIHPPNRKIVLVSGSLRKDQIEACSKLFNTINKMKKVMKDCDLNFSDAVDFVNDIKRILLEFSEKQQNIDIYFVGTSSNGFISSYTHHFTRKTHTWEPCTKFPELAKYMKPS